MNPILLIDDHPITNYINRKILQINGITNPITDFTNPVEALQVVKEKEKLIIFLDLNMPQMTGWQFLEILENGERNHKIVIVSSSTWEEDKLRALEHSNVVAYLTKPLNHKKINTLLKSLKLNT